MRFINWLKVRCNARNLAVIVRNSHKLSDGNTGQTLDSSFEELDPE